MLIDYFFLSNISIVSEKNTHVGCIDFYFEATSINNNKLRYCVECKNAHSKDIIKGLTDQLPKYMINKDARFGAYLVFWYKGEYFKLPKKDINSLQVELDTSMDSNVNSGARIRTFIIDLSKEKTASK